MKLFFCLVGFFLSSPLVSQAKTFRNAYVSFELPDAWNCKLEHTDWVCRSEIEKQSREAIIILTAKEVGPTDSLEQYMNHLAQAQPTAYKGAGSSVSRVIYKPKKVQVNDQTWVDGLHLGSEVPNYFTRYLATVKDRIAILVTLSAQKDFYTQYSPQFFKAVESLRVIATANINRNEVGPAGGGSAGVLGNASLPGLIEGGGEVGAGQMEAAPTSGGGGSSMLPMLFIGLAVLLAGAAGYIYYKSRPKN